MKRTFTTVSLLMVLSSVSHAQPDSLWSNHWGGNSSYSCYSVIEMEDGGFMLGCDKPVIEMSTQFWLIRTDSDGDSIWARKYGSDEAEECHGMIRTSDDCLLMAGFQTGDASDDFHAVKTNLSGWLQWTRSFGTNEDDYCYDVAESADSGFVFVGKTRGERYEMLVVKTDRYCQVEWMESYEIQHETTECTAVTIDNDDNIVIAGRGSRHQYGDQGVVMILDVDDGDVRREAFFRFEDTTNVRINDIITVSDGGLLAVGYLDHENSLSDGFIVRMDRRLNVQFTETVSVDGEGIVFNTVTESHNNCGFVAAGYNRYVYRPGEFPQYANNMFAYRFNESGDSLWSFSYGGTHSNDVCYSITPTDGFGYALAGNGVLRTHVHLLRVGSDHMPVDQESPNIHPSSLTIHEPYPNPFNSSTTITYSIPTPGVVTLYVISPLGQTVKTMILKNRTAGRHSVDLNMANMPTGLYLLKLAHDEYIQSKSIMLMK